MGSHPTYIHSILAPGDRIPRYEHNPMVIEWLAAGATMIAALMTAANLGARITGWGFAMFALGSGAWYVILYPSASVTGLEAARPMSVFP